VSYEQTSAIALNPPRKRSYNGAWTPHTVRGACCAILEAAQAAITFNSALFPTCYGIQFAEQPRNRNTIYSRPMRFDMICEANGIEYRLTMPNHLCTTG
jgi:hypothetical protein